MSPHEHLMVTAGILMRKNPHLEFLITQRPSTKNYSPNLWEFPGGKVDEGEDPKAGLIRELQEELGIIVLPGNLFLKHTHTYTFSNKKIFVDLSFYFCTLVSGTLTLLDCQEARWVKLEDLKKFHFCEADIPIIHHLERQYKNK